MSVSIDEAMVRRQASNAAFLRAKYDAVSRFRDADRMPLNENGVWLQAVRAAADALDSLLVDFQQNKALRERPALTATYVGTYLTTYTDTYREETKQLNEHK